MQNKIDLTRMDAILNRMVRFMYGRGPADVTVEEMDHVLETLPYDEAKLEGYALIVAYSSKTNIPLDSLVTKFTEEFTEYIRNLLLSNLQNGYPIVTLDGHDCDTCEKAGLCQLEDIVRRTKATEKSEVFRSLFGGQVSTAIN